MSTWGEIDTTSAALIGPVSTSKQASRVKRESRSPELKRKIVEESWAPGASVARIARADGVNANPVFTWRRKHRQGLVPAVREPIPHVLAVEVAEAPGEANVPGSAVRPAPPLGTIQIELAKGTVRIRGRADPTVLRTVLEVLAR